MVSNKAYLHLGPDGAESQSARAENGCGCVTTSCKRRHAAQASPRHPVSGTPFAWVCYTTCSQGRQATYYLLRNPAYRHITCKSTRPFGYRHFFSEPKLGNYLGALSNWVKLQNEARSNDDIIFSIVGWHAITLPQDPKELSAARKDMLATLLAFGIDPKKAVVFFQEDVSIHYFSYLVRALTFYRFKTTQNCRGY